MININELRRLAQAATPGPWGNTDPDPTIINSPYNQLAICYRNSRALTDAKFIAAANPAVINELIDRLEAAEKERDDLKAKIEQMEKQEPVAYMPNTTKFMLERGGSGVVFHPHDRSIADEPLYALPGAKGEEK